ncbi:hypothetical protein FQN54_008797 [Arachnomyces sp. PD_36]|nr:hypothetical protein FQN54_008797 [Arachnomyces sp. PD_36]
MTIQLLKATLDDVPELVDVYGDSFADFTITRLCNPKGTQSPAARESHSGMLEMQIKDPVGLMVKAVDTETGEILGYARWSMYLSGRTEEELNAPVPQRPANPEIIVELRDNFLNLLDKTRKEVMGGKPHCILNVLAVSPKHQRRGIGALLIGYGSDIADKEGVETYLESTPPGYELYKRNGFQDVGTISLDIGKWSGKEGEMYVIPKMIRPAQGKEPLLN